jgi:hypothetical protein
MLVFSCFVLTPRRARAKNCETCAKAIAVNFGTFRAKIVAGGPALRAGGR